MLSSYFANEASIVESELHFREKPKWNKFFDLLGNSRDRDLIPEIHQHLQSTSSSSN
jgi:hypothetical protein